MTPPAPPSTMEPFAGGGEEAVANPPPLPACYSPGGGASGATSDVCATLCEEDGFAVVAFSLPH
ncbi:hypothetical protein JZ751_003715 [Albula glossodonta]|uniref:Uncharacterized protein n=1 Tax=Albula glossodonta TaxID=121402 RepID=A0A8T2PDI1_9TELE|nr:hypothetical protein JZ751_003715 [Albula glossodonta]